MRPIRLTMQAFGPYAKREVVDFRHALGSGLFGIYGSTGAGKSTIFTAMTFALFGEAAKPEQDPTSLRSHHADPQLLTEVEFVIEIADARYLIRRRPTQTRPKLKGNGTTEDPHAAWLFDATGIPIDDLTDANSGKIIAEKKVGEVDAAISNLLGYGADQFKQIVLLPQGKFETFLTSQTDKRFAILSELFDVSLYQKLSEKLKEDAREAEKVVRAARELCSNMLQLQGFQTQDDLRAAIEAALQQQTELEALEKAARQTALIAAATLNNAQQIEQKFLAAENAASALNLLLSRADEFARLSEKIKKAEIAQSLIDVDDAARSATVDVERTLQETVRVAGALIGAKTFAEASEQKLLFEKARVGEVQDLRLHAAKLQQHRDTLDSAIELRANAALKQDARQRAKDAFRSASNKLGALNEQLKIDDERLKQSRLTQVKRAALVAQVTATTHFLKDAETHETLAAGCKAAKANYEQCLEQHENLETVHKDFRSKLEEAEAALSRFQAVHLARSLQDGEPCPVCGSNEHPSPANGTIEHSGLEEAFRKAKRKLDESQASLNTSSNKIASAKAVHEERSAQFSALSEPEQPSAKFRSALNSLNVDIDRLGPVIDIKALELALFELKSESELATDALDVARIQKEQTGSDADLANNTLSLSLASIPPELQSDTALASAIEANSKSIAARTAALETAEAEARNTREAALVAQKDDEAAKNSHAEAMRRHRTATINLTNRLAKVDMSLDEFNRRKADIPTIATDEAALTTYKSDLTIAQSTGDATQEAIREIVRPDLPALENLNEAATQNAIAASRNTEALKHRAIALQQLQSDIIAQLADSERTEAESGPLRTLAAAFNAGNQFKLDLETFAITAMFDQVLNAANLRLQPMSDGRYLLQRHLGGIKGNQRQGLDIRVHDIQTGRPRGTTTLSGGETFIAALALALGLSDIVESVNGNIRLDTIFIDEGFGSLDTDNDAGTLERVLQALTHLVGKNRAVGLISHVPLVQQTIPNGFYVVSTPSGSRVESRHGI